MARVSHEGEGAEEGDQRGEERPVIRYGESGNSN